MIKNYVRNVFQNRNLYLLFASQLKIVGNLHYNLSNQISRHHCITALQTTDLVKTTDDSIDITVTPKIMYQFQAVAREDKGVIGGIDWNKSPTVEFKTSSTNREGG